MTQHPRNLQDPNLGPVLVRKNSLIRIKILFLGQNRPQVNQLKFIKILKIFPEMLKIICHSQF